MSSSYPPPRDSNDSSAATTSCGVEIPVEIVSEEEMALIEAALASAARSLLASSSSCSRMPSVLSPLRRHASSAVSAASSRTQASPPPDMEDLSRSSPPRSPLERFRSRRGLMVTDFTAAEWCEKQMEFGLNLGKPQKTDAMKAGSDRHFELEKEVVEKIRIRTKSIEEIWALKFMSFIVGSNQLIFEGLTRELPVLGVVEGIWMIGVIDEIRLPAIKASKNPFLVDTKTRYKATLPAEAQKRNSRLQLMCYKYLWDNLVAGNFPMDHFFSYFDLNPQYILSKDIKQYTTSLGVHVEVFGDVVTYFRDTCRQLPPSQDQLLLRYELQSDRSLLGEHQFAHDASWFEYQIKGCLKFWLGEREATYVPQFEDWKCRFCTFTDMCPKTATSNNRKS